MGLRAGLGGLGCVLWVRGCAPRRSSVGWGRGWGLARVLWPALVGWPGSGTGVGLGVGLRAGLGGLVWVLVAALGRDRWAGGLLRARRALFRAAVVFCACAAGACKGLA